MIKRLSFGEEWLKFDKFMLESQAFALASAANLTDFKGSKFGDICRQILTPNLQISLANRVKFILFFAFGC